MTRFPAICLTAALLALSGGDDLRAQAGVATTNHPPVPARLSQYWLVPEPVPARTAERQAESPATRFARGAALIADGDFTAGLPLVRSADLLSTPLGPYSRYYSGVALLGLRR